MNPRKGPRVKNGERNGQGRERDEWTDRMRSAMSAVAGAITGMYDGVGVRGGLTDRGNTAALLNAVGELVQVQEGINNALHRRINEMSTAYSKVVTRLETLENVLAKHSISPSTSSQPLIRKSLSSHNSPPSSRRRPIASRESTPRLGVVEARTSLKCRASPYLKDIDPGFKNNGEPMNKSTNHNLIEVTDVRNIREENEACVMVIESDSSQKEFSRSLKRQRVITDARTGSSEIQERIASKSAIKSVIGGVSMQNPRPPRTNLAPRPLPTLRDVEAELEESHRQRVQRRPEPPPCDRCRVRKRADMMRQKGYVDENVFDRWAAKPGGCLGFMHMDEPGAPPSPLSFPDTATCSPDS